MDPTTAYIRDMFTRFQRYYGDDWQIDPESWFAWWAASGRAEEKLTNSYGVRLRRIDKRKPWTVDNINLVLAPAADENKAVNSKPKVLTVGQWLEEIGYK